MAILYFKVNHNVTSIGANLTKQTTSCGTKYLNIAISLAATE